MAEGSTTNIDAAPITQGEHKLLKKIKIVGIIAVIIISAIFITKWYFDLQKKADVDFVNFDWTDHHPTFGSSYVHVEGTLFNSGERDAGNVELMTRIYDSNNRLIKTDKMYVGDIPAKTYKNISTDITYSGNAHTIESEIGYEPYG